MCGKESILHALITIEVGWPSESVGQKKVNCREIVQTALSCLREMKEWATFSHGAFKVFG